MSFFRRRKQASSAPSPTDTRSPVELVLAYHARSKHDFQRFAASMGFLDWANQPDPFRRHAGAPRLELGLPAGAAERAEGAGPEEAAAHSTAPSRGGGEARADEATAADPSRHEPTMDTIFEPGAVPPRAVSREALSHFLFHALALSAGKRIETSAWSLRVNPSSGNLHPTEGWLVLPALDEREAPALWHYAPDAHALEQRARLRADFANALFASLPEGAFLVALSSIAWREGWKYGERAYRYVNHDVGHALGALRYAAALCGWTLSRVPRLSTARLGELLGLVLDDDGPEAEMPDLLAVVRPAGTPPPAPDWTLPPGAPLGELQGTPNTLSSEHHDWPILAAMERLCRDAGEGAGAASGERGATGNDAAATSGEPGTTGDSSASGSGKVGDGSVTSAALRTTGLSDVEAARGSAGLSRLIRKRRSAVAMDRTTRLPADAFYRMLAAVHPALAPAPFDALAAPPRVHLFLFVHRVDDLAPGLYLLPRHARGLELFREASAAPFAYTAPPGCPPELPLVLLHEDDARTAAARVSCGQDIAGDGCFSLGMLAEFEPVLRAEGPAAYPRLYWETGLIGQVLYLQAHAAGVSATGIGCFFDDPVHALAGLRDRRFQSLYHFTVGGAVHDPRIVDEPPYAHLARDPR